jgi:hypothetical protein
MTAAGGGGTLASVDLEGHGFRAGGGRRFRPATVPGEGYKINPPFCPGWDGGSTARERTHN